VTVFESATISGVLGHMNGDHPEDSLLIARAFGDPAAESATMTGLDGAGGSWEYTIGGAARELMVPWSEPITERPEIRREIVVLYDAACARLGIEPRAH
jgi:hypothetical protein